MDSSSSVCTDSNRAFLLHTSAIHLDAGFMLPKQRQRRQVPVHRRDRHASPFRALSIAVSRSASSPTSYSGLALRVYPTGSRTFYLTLVVHALPLGYSQRRQHNEPGSHTGRLLKS